MCILIKNENDGIYGTELYNEDSIINSIEVDDNYKLFKFKLLLFFSLSIIFYFINKYIIFNYYQNLYKII